MHTKALSCGDVCLPERATTYGSLLNATRSHDMVTTALLQLLSLLAPRVALCLIECHSLLMSKQRLDDAIAVCVCECGGWVVVKVNLV